MGWTYYLSPSVRRHVCLCECGSKGLIALDQGWPQLKPTSLATCPERYPNLNGTWECRPWQALPKQTCPYGRASWLPASCHTFQLLLAYDLQRSQCQLLWKHSTSAFLSHQNPTARRSETHKAKPLGWPTHAKGAAVRASHPFRWPKQATPHEPQCTCSKQGIRQLYDIQSSETKAMCNDVQS